MRDISVFAVYRKSEKFARGAKEGVNTSLCGQFPESNPASNGCSIPGQGEDVLQPGLRLAAEVGDFDGAEKPDGQEQA